MSESIKTKSELTPEEEIALKFHTDKWITNAYKTGPVDKEKLTEAIKGIYKVSGLKEPRVVIVPSPMVMVFAYGASAAIFDGDGDGDTHIATRSATHIATRSATHIATRSATHDATYNATRSATRNATDRATANATRNATRYATDNATRSATRNATAKATAKATRDATYNATRNATANATHDATRNATYNATDHATANAINNPESEAAQACYELAAQAGLDNAKEWGDAYQGGNMWAYYDCYITAFRDVLGLELPEYEKYHYWEQAAIHGGFRVMHEEFCIVSEFPEYIKIDSDNQPHCEDGPSHRWSDGWELFHVHGKAVPKHWIMDRDNVSTDEVMKTEDVELRAIGCELIGWDKVAHQMNRKVIDGDPNSDVGALVELSMEGLEKAGRFLMAQCPRNGTICEGVPRVSDIDGSDIETAFEAQAWRGGFSVKEYQHPTIRT